MNKISPLFVIIVLSLFSDFSLAGTHYIHIKSGDYNIDTTRQTVFGRILDITEKDSSSFAVEYQYKFENNISIGGEVLEAKHRYTDTENGNMGDIYTSMFLFEAKYNIDLTQWLYSFVGLSAGLAVSEFDGPVTGNTVGTALGYSAGLTFRFSNHVGLTFQYKQMDSDTEDSAGNKFDASGRSLTANVSVFF